MICEMYPKISAIISNTGYIFSHYDRKLHYEKIKPTQTAFGLLNNVSAYQLILSKKAGFNAQPDNILILKRLT